MSFHCTIVSGKRGLAAFSPCEKYRYMLHRKLPTPRGPRGDLGICFIGLNPSTADQDENDPTVTRCCNFATAWGYCSMYMLNIFALRSTDPAALYRADDPIGAENDEHLDQWISECRARADAVNVGCVAVCAWGDHGKYRNRGDFVRDRIKKLSALYRFRINKSGQPVHPLYLPADLVPVLWHPKG